MKYYVGETFEEAKRTAKEYKSLLYAKKKADNTGETVFDENGTKVHPLNIELTDDVPDGALDKNEDGTTKVYDEEGNVVGSMTEEEVKQIEDAITDQDIEAAIVAANTTEEVHGKIRRVFDGKLRLRRRPSSDDDAICGVTMFDEKAVTERVTVSGRTWYKTTDGFWISGAPEHTEFVEGNM